ncbi:hypothetical protein LTR66_003890 [Elasticomyces elasticus]|nr:hypothetical protein LTR50_007538 [Elasticomyces elasticus]KAK4996527.1 hypothetical protein LTR66_003890 [Elasticomyces elasticus]KAK5007559.1 hypothetical protein LTR28_005136 [Elasticomyces elasticus]
MSSSSRQVDVTEFGHTDDISMDELTIQGPVAPFASDDDTMSTTAPESAADDVALNRATKRRQQHYEKQKARRKEKRAQTQAIAATDAPIFEVRDAAGKGKGLFAIRHIPRGTRILSEQALIACSGFVGNGSVTKAFYGLPADKRSAYMDLDCKTVLPGEQDISEPLRNQLLPARAIIAVFQTNFVVEQTHTLRMTVYLQASRLNHSCVPNALASYNSAVAGQVVHAIHDIKPDEEITISYIQSLEYGRQTRNNELKQPVERWFFTCECEACGTKDRPNETSDAMRERLNKMRMNVYKSMSRWIEGSCVDFQRLKAMLEKRVKILRSEHLIGTRDFIEAVKYASWASYITGDILKALEYKQCEKECVLHGFDCDSKLYQRVAAELGRLRRDGPNLTKDVEAGLKVHMKRSLEEGKRRMLAGQRFVALEGVLEL